MKKLKTLEEFNNLNSDSILNNTNSISVFGGRAQNTGDLCITLNDTCVNGRSDIYHHSEQDGVVLSDQTSWTE